MENKKFQEVDYWKINCNRFRKHLEKIAYEFEVEWIDGEFPIEEIINKCNCFLFKWGCRMWSASTWTHRNINS